MRFTGLGVGHLEYKAHTVHRLVVENEPNWLELCSKVTAGKPDPADTESEEDSCSDDDPEEDLDGDTF